ncbi:MAG TPA: EAL domain-containing protein [Burkholderiales bacterium]
MAFHLPRRFTLDGLIYAFAAYGLPVAIGVLTWVALAAWEPQYRAAGAVPLELRVLEDSGGALDPPRAAARLARIAPVPHYDTRLAETPFWFAFAVRPDAGAREVELPSRHAMEIACWEGAPLTPLGHASRSAAAGVLPGDLRAVKAGFALRLPPGAEPVAVLCRATHVGPARIAALQWTPDALNDSVQEFNRGAGLLEGGLVVLALFVLVTGLINRDSMYVLFAAWLVASLRMGAISAGWDTQWLDRAVPADWILPARQLTIAAYYLLTYALFRRLFRDDLRQLGHAAALRVAQLSCVAIFAAALLLPFQRFLPVLWVTAAIGIAVLAFLLARILAVTRSKVAMWYSASLALVLFAGFYEVIAAALGAKLLIGAVNHVNAALASSLLVALAIAQQMREEHRQRVRAQGELSYLANHDALTGVLNRRGLENRIGAEVARLPAGRSLALAYLDLDRFKLINDLFGHVAGDDVLRQVCRRTEALIGGTSAMGRIGGDEFVLVFPGATVRAAAEACRGVVDAIGNRAYQTGDKAFQVKGSIGLVEVPAGTTVSDAISMADQACRAAKGGRHEGLVVLERNAAAFKEREQELRLVKRLGETTAPEGLFLAMQPIMSLRTPRAALDFEVLVRMREADGSVVPGGRIIEAAENNGRVAVIDRWVLEHVLDWLEAQQPALARTRFVCMNLSGGSLNDERFVREAFALLAERTRAARMLCVEITESVALHDLGNTRRFIDRLRGFGARVALDDFGAGYTSFSYLKELPADALKIDGHFVRGLPAHPANLAIIEAIGELARNLGMQTIAEWAEDAETLEALLDAGIDYVQGYAVAKPLAPEQILEAQSAAAFIEDPAVARFVGERLRPPHERRARGGDSI